jgi:hypothetical protein
MAGPRVIDGARPARCSTEARVFEFLSHVLVTAARKAQMRYGREFITTRTVAGVLIVVPCYLAVLLLLKGMKSVATLVRPFAALVPDWIPAERLLSLALVLALCFLVGVAVRTRSGRVVREGLERALFERLPRVWIGAQFDAATGGRR